MVLNGNNEKCFMSSYFMAKRVGRVGRGGLGGGGTQEAAVDM